MTLFSAIFFAGYFFLLKFPSFPVTGMPLTALDRWIPFQPAALLPYVSLWVYVPLAPGLLEDKRELLTYYGAMIALALAGLAVFFFWPTSIPPMDIDWMRHPAFARLKEVDSAGNACPSLHVAFAVFTAVWLDLLLRRMGEHSVLRVLSWCWCAGILYSTLATKQHVVIDVLAGTALGLVAALCHVTQAKNRGRVDMVEGAKPVEAG